LRLFNVYGKGEGHKGEMRLMILKLYEQLKDGKNPTIFKMGEQARDFVYINDVVSAFIKAGFEDDISGIYDIGSGKTVTFNKIVKILQELLKTNKEINYIDNPYTDRYQNNTVAKINEIFRPNWDIKNGIKDYFSKS
jgi:ADP-L-glycero-D-manno-heptose 6-epimerase